MTAIIVKNVKAGPFGKLTECILNRLNISQIGLVVFNWLLTINTTTEAIFKQTERCAQRKIDENFLFDS